MKLLLLLTVLILLTSCATQECVDYKHIASATPKTRTRTNIIAAGKTWIPITSVDEGYDITFTDGTSEWNYKKDVVRCREYRIVDTDSNL